MIKKLSVILLLIGSPIVAASLEERLEEAVCTHNPLKVSYLLRQLDRSAPSDKTKDFIADLSQLADDSVDSKEERVSVLNDTTDLSMALIGSAIGALGLIYFGHRCYSLYHAYYTGRHSLSELFLWYNGSVADNASMALAPGLWGAYLAYKGLTCAKQKEALKRARMVQDLLDDKREES